MTKTKEQLQERIDELEAQLKRVTMEMQWQSMFKAYTSLPKAMLTTLEAAHKWYRLIDEGFGGDEDAIVIEAWPRVELGDHHPAIRQGHSLMNLVNFKAARRTKDPT